MKIGIVGLPNVGKSTLFRALTRKQVNIANYPFVTIEPNIGVVEVPDERVDALAELSHSRKKVHAVVEFVDIAGLVAGAAEGQGLGNKFLAHIREVDVIAEVVRVFEDPDVIHVSGKPDPASDIRVIEIELGLKDLETVSKRLETSARQTKAGDKTARIQREVLERAAVELKAGKPAGSVFDGDAREEITLLSRELGLLTAKPRIVVLNASEREVQEHWQPAPDLLSAIGADHWLSLSAKLEDELAALPEADRAEYLAALGLASLENGITPRGITEPSPPSAVDTNTDELVLRPARRDAAMPFFSAGLAESGLDLLIGTGYRTLGLITFLTTGEDETRAWTIPAGSSAPSAGRAIHSDFEQKFIRAEVITYAKLIGAGSLARARELGWIRTEGREYIVEDGDVVEFKI